MITIYDAKAADFSTLGLGALLPTKCTVSEMAGGMYELKIVHPITSDMRHDRIKPMRIIKAPAPVRETPQVEIGQSGSVTRSIYKVVTDGRRLYLRVKPDQESKGLHAYKPGTEVATVELSADGKWRRVIILDGGATGWMWAGNLEYVRTETEIITGDAPGTIIRPRQTREQLFRVYFYSPDTKTRTVTAEARHITYDLVGAIVDGEYSPENVPADQVCAQIMAKADHDISDFHIYCTITDPISGDYGGRNILDCLLDPETGVVAQTKARVIRDNYDIFILPDEARNRGVELRYGKNLLAAHMDADTSDTITRIKPVGKDKNGEKLYITENGGWVESPYINDYSVIHSKEVEYDVVESDELPINQARAMLKEKAEADFAAGCDMATVKLDADFVRLELTEDYRHLANAYALHLYDSVPVIDREADIVATARMTQYVYDAILDEYSDTGLGELNEVKSTIYGYEIAQGTVSGGKLIPNTVNGDRLQNLSVSYGKFDLAAINQLSANAITAIRADIRELVAGNITTDQLYADLAVIAAAQITAANIEKANIQWAEIENLAVEIAKVVNAEIKHAKIDWAQIENAEIDAADIKNLSASIATIVKAEIALAEIDWAQIKNAEIDTAQIKLGAITQALIAAGAIGTAQIADGSITEAKVVSLNADVIKTGTLSVERLLLKGANGLFYALNATAGGLTSTQLTQEQYKNAISGTALVARSVTADKIAAKSITANEILSGTITAAEINVANLFAAQATIAALDNYILRTQTIEAIEGKLDVWAENKINLAVGGLQIGGTNLLKDTRELTSWYLSSNKAWRYTNESNFARIQFANSGQTTNTWIHAMSPISRLPDGWYGKQVTLSAYVWSEDWAGLDVGSVWTLCLSQGGTTRLNYGDKSATKAGCVEVADGVSSDKALVNYQWIRVSLTWTLDETDITRGDGVISDNTHVFVSFYLPRNGGYRIYAPKLELGNKATDWSPAPEDMEEAIGVVSAELLIQADAIKGKVEQKDFDALGKTVSDNHSEFTQTADSINQRVTDEIAGLQAQIDVNAEGILLQAGRTVGGRNYIVNSKGPYTATGTGATLKMWLWKCASLEEADSLYGKKVTISFDYETAITSGMFNVLVNTTWQIVEAFDSNGKTGHVSKTMTISEATATAATFLYIDGAWTGSVTFSNVKVEIGDYATDWSPHPDDPASSVDAGGVVRVDQTGVHMTGGTIEMETSDGDEYIHIRSDGVSASSLSAPDVAPRYAGPSALYVNPSATSAQIAAGNYFRSLADALSKLSQRVLHRDVAISMASGMTEYGTVNLSGVFGGGQIVISGNGAKLVGGLSLSYGAAGVTVNDLRVDMTGGTGISADGWVKLVLQGCIITGTGSGYGVYSTNNAGVTVSGCEIYDCSRSLYGIAGGEIDGYACKGNCRVGANRTTLYLHDSMPCDSTTWTAGAWAGQVLTANISVDQGSKPTVEPAPATAYYSYTGSDSYCTGWSWFSDDDIVQGYIGNRVYGTIWFDASAIKSALSGKTIKQASLRLFMRKNFGRGTAVSVQLYGTNMAYSGRSGAPGLTTSYGTIGTTEPGEANEITIPTAVISDIASGKIVGLVLYSDDTELYKDRDYSRNYAKFAGSGTATADTCPRLTVVYR